MVLAKNSLIDELRRLRRHVPLDETVEALIAQPRPDEQHRLEARIALLQALMRLSPRCRFVLEGYYIAEMPAQELAAHLRIQPQSLYSLLKRCLGQLANILKK